MECVGGVRVGGGRTIHMGGVRVGGGRYYPWRLRCPAQEEIAPPHAHCPTHSRNHRAGEKGLWGGEGEEAEQQCSPTEQRPWLQRPYLTCCVRASAEKEPHRCCL